MARKTSPSLSVALRPITLAASIVEGGRHNRSARDETMILRAVVVPHLVYAEPHFVLEEGEQYLVSVVLRVSRLFSGNHRE